MKDADDYNQAIQAHDMMKETVKIDINMTDLVKGNFANFSFFRNGMMYYTINYKNTLYQFPIIVNSSDENYDLGNATLNNTEKAMTLMRYIRKSIDNGTFVKQIW